MAFFRMFRFRMVTFIIRTTKTTAKIGTYLHAFVRVKAYPNP